MRHIARGLPNIGGWGSKSVCNGTRPGLCFDTARGRGNGVGNTQGVNFLMRNIVDTAVLVSMFYHSPDRTKTMSKTRGFRWC
jgi:hypothetical protein